MRITLQNLLTAAALCSLVSGCAFHRNYTYETHTWEVEEDGVLGITAYPADYSDTKFHIPFVLLISEGPKEVNFQLHLSLHDKERKGISRRYTPAGYTPATGVIEKARSCTITEFSYQLPGKNRVNLIDEKNPWRGTSWAVDKVKGKKPDPLPYLKGQSVDVRVKLKLKDKLHVFEGKMEAHRKRDLPIPIVSYYGGI